ncbi:hypothetical protein GCM10009616_36080 [Microlunatus lacustris]
MTDECTLLELKAAYAGHADELFLLEGLFEDLDPAPVFRRGAAEYLLQLVTVPFRPPGDPDSVPWSLWSLAPEYRRWQSWAEHHARDQDRGWLDGVEHVWLTRHGVLQRALVHITTQTILQPRPTLKEES